MQEENKISQRKPLTQRERTARHKALHPHSEAARDEKRRRRDELLLFHIRRRTVSGIPIPEGIDQGSKAFKRAEEAYKRQCSEKVEVIYGSNEEESE